MSGQDGMRALIAAATHEAMQVVVGNPKAIARCKADSDAIIAAIRGEGSAGACRAETWLSMAMTMAALAVTSGKEAPVVKTQAEKRDAALGILDAVLAMAADTTESMMAQPGAEAGHAVKH